ncbi:MAG: 2-C-methyl-D-erythritol 2,4-cyclodiphosphate synthase [Nitrospinae bacterium]|nr:2-C-methyl-D-erythritol 2,4-cyclodiphosphate synthase [Nitrospinota bacterium]
MVRIGNGFDAHRITGGRSLVLGGVTIDFDGKGLLGHSDADVLVHAICDALLGAAALGDIGKHFPDTDPQYRGISSVILLHKTARLLADADYRVVNVDATIIAEAPRIAPHIGMMRKNLADAMGTDIANVSVKATTTEKLGFTGRGEGMAAWAVALIGKK